MSAFGVEIERSISEPLRKFPVAREPNRVTFSMSGYLEKVSDIFCNKFVGMPNAEWGKGHRVDSFSLSWMRQAL